MFVFLLGSPLSSTLVFFAISTTCTTTRHDWCRISLVVTLDGLGVQKLLLHTVAVVSATVSLVVTRVTVNRIRCGAITSKVLLPSASMKMLPSVLC
jgi:hypothetical protein